MRQVAAGAGPGFGENGTAIGPEHGQTSDKIIDYRNHLKRERQETAQQTSNQHNFESVYA